MSGNVWEWVNDWYDKNYYKNSPKNNPKGPNSGQYRAVRGGDWNGPPQFVLASPRSMLVPTERVSNGGFRVVLAAQ